jgi:hypothetical protein
VPLISTLKHNLYIKRSLFGIIIFLSVLAGMLAFKMPGVLPATTSLEEFSAERAASHVSAISQNPHPMGSEENRQVRDYIISELANMGITAEVQETTVPDYFAINDGEQVSIYNIIAILPGTNSTGSIALVGHYDTVPVSPGANDDGAAVATLLETARSLLEGPVLQNDVIILFTDAEEPGQFRYGARYFVNNSELSNDVRLLINFEAIGRTGPSIMFETGPDNDWLIEGFSQSVPNPVAFSFMSDLYRLVAKGGTDFIAFEEAGINGFDFAYSFERTIYHTALDNIENTDERSLQHHGDYALSLTRYFGELDLAQITAGSSEDVVYHSFFGETVVYYPAYWALPLAILTGVLIGGLAIVGIKRGTLTPRDVTLGPVVFFVEIIAITLVLTLAWWGIDELHLAFGTVVEPTIQVTLYFIAFLAATMAIMIALRIWIRKWLVSPGLTLGSILCWWLLALLASVYLPGFTIILIWPLIISLLPLSWILLKKPGGSNSWGHFALISISTIILLVIMTVPVYLFFQAMGVSSPGFSGSPSFPIIGLSIIFWVMLLGLLLPHLEFFGNYRQRKVLYAVLAVAGICLVAGSFIPGMDIESFGLIN